MQSCHNEQGSQQKGQAVTQVVFEVDRRDQHNHQRTAKEKPGPAGEYKNTALIQCDFACRRDAPVNPLVKPSAKYGLDAFAILVGAGSYTVH
jgi:hypothetical protein